MYLLAHMYVDIDPHIHTDVDIIIYGLQSSAAGHTKTTSTRKFHQFCPEVYSKKVLWDADAFCGLFGAQSWPTITH